MKRGLRFQTKLMLTLVTAISAVTISLILVTENKVSQAYSRQFSRDFRRLATQLERSREERSQEFMELCSHLAGHPYVVASLKGKSNNEQQSAFWKFYRDSLEALDSGDAPIPDHPMKRPGSPEDPKRPSITPELIARIGSVGIVHPDGEIKTFALAPLNGGRESDGRGAGTARFRKSPTGVSRAKKRIDELLARDGQQSLFVPFEMPDGTSFVQEMVSTPVKDPGNGKALGLFLRAASVETEAQRFLERYQEEFESDAPLLTGIFLDGQLYSRSLDPKTATLMGSVLSDRIAQTPLAPTKGDYTFDAEIGGEPHRFFVKPLAGDTTSDPAWQVSAFSLATLKTDLAELRLRGSGVGAGALLLGIVIAWIFSRRLAVPIGELTRATRAIQSGDLEARITIRSRDEIGELAVSFNEMAEGLRQRDIYRGILEKVSDETVAQAMISGELDLELGGEQKTVSVLFCDIRGFTGLTEHMPPTEVIALLNKHMTAMTVIVRKHFGVVDKFVGDEIMGVFGALKSYGNDAAHVVACALEMVRERERLNLESDHPIEIGIGVATGEAVAGCMGSVDRLNYTVVGSRVNLASRLCSEAGPMEVVIDDQTLSRLAPDRVESEAMPELRLKGFSEPVTAYRVSERRVAAVV